MFAFLFLPPVAEQAQVRASVALCNIAAASHRQGRSPLDFPPAEGPAITMLQPQRGSDDEEGKAASTSERTSELAGNENNDKLGENAGSDIPTGADVGQTTCDERYWLRSTDILPKIIAGGLVRATGEVKGNLLRAMNNLMCSQRTRAEIVHGQQMANLFELVHGYTDEVRDSTFVNSTPFPDSWPALAAIDSGSFKNESTSVPVRMCGQWSWNEGKNSNVSPPSILGGWHENYLSRVVTPSCNTPCLWRCPNKTMRIFTLECSRVGAYSVYEVYLTRRNEIFLIPKVSQRCPGAR